jgi:hypothetical protein
MGRKVLFWASTGVLSALSLFAAFAYLSGSQQAVDGFAHVGYPQQLRIILGIAKPLGALALLARVLPDSKSGPMQGSLSRGYRHS